MSFLVVLASFLDWFSTLTLKEETSLFRVLRCLVCCVSSFARLLRISLRGSVCRIWTMMLPENPTATQMMNTMTRVDHTRKADFGRLSSLESLNIGSIGRFVRSSMRRSESSSSWGRLRLGVMGMSGDGAAWCAPSDAAEAEKTARVRTGAVSFGIGMESGACRASCSVSAICHCLLSLRISPSP